MNIDIAFYKANGRRRDRVIRRWTRSPYSHVEILLMDGETLVGINPPTKNIVKKSFPGKYTLERDWDLVSISIDSDQEKRLLEFTSRTMGHKYDWVGMLLSNLVPFKVKQKNRWYCSEWVLEALLYADILQTREISPYNHRGVSPGELFTLLQSKI